MDTGRTPVTQLCELLFFILAKFMAVLGLARHRLVAYTRIGSRLGLCSISVARPVRLCAKAEVGECLKIR